MTTMYPDAMPLTVMELAARSPEDVPRFLAGLSDQELSMVAGAAALVQRNVWRAECVRRVSRWWRDAGDPAPAGGRSESEPAWPDADLPDTPGVPSPQEVSGVLSGDAVPDADPTNSDPGAEPDGDPDGGRTDDAGADAAGVEDTQVIDAATVAQAARGRERGWVPVGELVPVTALPATITISPRWPTPVGAAPCPAVLPVTVPATVPVQARA